MKILVTGWNSDRSRAAAGRSRILAVIAAASMALLGVGAVPAGAAVHAGPRAGAGRPLVWPRPAWPLRHHAPSAATAEARRLATSAPGRVQQLQGQSGYAFDLPSTDMSVTSTVTIPTLNCNGLPRAQPFGIQLSLEIGGAYSMVQTFCFGGQQYNEINFSGQNFQSGGWFATIPGRQIQMSETRDSTGVTATITDLAVPGNTKTVSFPGATAGGGYVGILDAGVENPTTGGVPPYTPVGFSATDVSGTPLGAYIQTVNYAEQNSVWGANLQDQTSDVGSGDSFSITNANSTLPTVAVSASPQGVERPSSGTATITFTVTLSSSSTYPVYLDYATQDDGAKAGTDYVATSGTLTYPPGTTSQTVQVTVNAGPESGGELDFLLSIANPSYAYNPPGSAGVGRIYAGPMVLQADPSVVPLDGGGAMTLTGVFYGPAGSSDTVQFCAAGGGACTAAASSTVVSDTTITLTVPDLKPIGPPGATSFLADMVVTDTHGVSSPLTASDEVHVGCTKVTNRPDGAWGYTGCVTQTDSTDNVTEQRSFLDGMQVSASANDQVDYSTGGTAGDAVTSTASSTVSLNVAGELDAIFSGQLDQALSGPVTFSPPTGAKVEGMALAGPVTLTPAAGNQATATVSVKAPPWLGSVTGTMTFTTGASGGVSNLQVQLPQASFGNLLSLTGVSLSWSSSSGWQLNGTASIGGGNAETALINGSATYVNNKLTAASLSIPGDISVFGLFHFSGLTVTFSTTKGWSGTAALSQGDGGGTATISLTAGANGTITAGSLVVTSSTGTEYLGQLLQVQTFTLTYDHGGWAATATVPAGDKGTLSGSLEVAGGIINSASITLTSFPVGGWLTVKSASLKYALINGQHQWTGAFDARLQDQTRPISGLQANLTITDGVPTAGGLGLVGNVPVPFLDGLFINQLGATLQWVPLPVTVIESHVAIGLGPVVSGGQLASLTGSFTRNTPQVPLIGSYAYTGTLSILGGQVGSATAVLQDNDITTITLTLGPGNGVPLTVGPVSLTGKLTGTWTTTKFTLDGDGTVALKGEGSFTGTIHVEAQGMAACQGTKRGFKWIFGQAPQLQPQGHCSTVGF